MKTFSEIGLEIGNLVEEKNKAYGSSFQKSEEILKILYPNGIGINQYSDLLSIVRILDKIFRIATNKNSFDEEPYKDIAGYGILGVHKEQEK